MLKDIGVRYMCTEEISSRPYLLVLGGTGMLRGAVRELIDRHYIVISLARRPQRGVPAEHMDDRFIGLTGDWCEPEDFASQILAALRERGATTSELAGAIVWVHSPYRHGVLDQLERVLDPTAQVLQLWGSAVEKPQEIMTRENHVRRSWKSKHLYLGYHASTGAPRWLTNDEISQAALRAWEAPHSGDGYFVAGQTEPWEQRP